MHTSKTTSTLLAAGALCAAIMFTALPLTAYAQAPPPELELGIIEGTDMLRDEFRARGLAQLTAIALNTLAYYEVEGEYPADFYELRRSAAWNLEPSNIFTGRPVQALSFEPEDGDLTNAPPLDVISIDIPATPGPVVDITDPDGGFDPGKFGEALSQTAPPNASRVDPHAITDPLPGEVFYFVNGGLLQLIMYAPDGTFVEYVDGVPNRSWLERFRTGTASNTWPGDLYAAEVLFYMEHQLPQMYNLVQFMGDNETTPRPRFAEMGADERLLLAEELGITVLNPYTKDPATLAREEFSLGDFFEPDPASRLPLYMCLAEGRVLSLAGLTEGRSEIAPEPEEDPGYKRRGQGAERPAAPPMGGR